MGIRAKGTGSVFQSKDGKWRATITTFGTPHYYTGGTKRECDAWIKAEQAKVKPTGYTVASAADAWMSEHVEPQCRKSTQLQYRQMLDLHILPRIGHIKVEDVKRGDIQGVISAMNGSRKATSTMNAARRTAHGLFEWLISLDIVSLNPCDRVRVPAVPAKPRKALTQWEVTTVLRAMQPTRWRHAVRFLLLTGLRRGELIGLKWSDLKDGWLTISRAISPQGEELLPKTAAGIRRFKMPEAALKVWFAQREQLAMERIASEWVFPARDGTPIAPVALSTIIQARAKSAGVQMSMHELRHTFASQALASKGVDIKALQTMLGHKSAAHTLDIYGHLVEDSLVKAAAMVDGFADRLLSEDQSIVIPLKKID